MKRYFIFLFWMIFFVTPAEYIIHTLILPDGDYLGAIFIYMILANIYYIFRRKSFEREESRKERGIEALILGYFGLFVMEWMIIGNSPSGNPEAMHTSMFIWWIWVFLFSKAMISENYLFLRRRILIYHISYSLLFSIVAYSADNPLTFVILYAYGLWVFYIFLYSYIMTPLKSALSSGVSPIISKD